jgi:hypothetical protein
MSDFDYVKHLGKPDSCAATYNEQNPVVCRTADIRASGEGCWPSAPTFIGGSITADSHIEIYAGYSGTVQIDKLTAPAVTLTCTHSATMIIRKLSGVQKLEIHCDYASTIHIIDLQATDVQIYVSYSSKLLLDRVDVDKMSGLIDYASFGRSRGRIGQPDIQVRHASTWDSQPIDAPLATSAGVWESSIAASSASAG